MCLFAFYFCVYTIFNCFCKQWQSLVLRATRYGIRFVHIIYIIIMRVPATWRYYILINIKPEFVCCIPVGSYIHMLKRNSVTIYTIIMFHLPMNYTKIFYGISISKINIYKEIIEMTCRLKGAWWKKKIFNPSYI